MKQFMLGLVIGSALTGGLVGAGTFYDSKGQPNAPTGSIQQYDYFRQRQLFLDAGAIRKQAERDRIQQQLNPCGR